MITCRAMTWREACDYEDFITEIMAQNPNLKENEFLRKAAEYIFANIYHADVENYHLGEVKAVIQRTLELSNEIREDEIKNLKPGQNGSETVPATAKTAEK